MNARSLHASLARWAGLASVVILAVAGAGRPATAQDRSSADFQSAWSALDVLVGSWKSAATSASGAHVEGGYAFRRDLAGHVMSRSSQSSACKGPESFDCDHGDVFYVFEDRAVGMLKAIYFDNEGHVIRYDVAAPEPGHVVFLSSPDQPGPRFRLDYVRHGDVLDGKFQMQPPGAGEWITYLAWSGPRAAAPVAR